VQQGTEVRQDARSGLDPELAPADWAAADEMRRRTFTVAEQGYAQDEVRGYLTHLAEVFAHQAAQLAELKRAESEAPHPPQNGGEDPSGLASRIADVLKEAEEHAARTREDAEGEAKLILAGAQQKADQAERNAEQLVAEARQKAQEEAERKVADAEQRAQKADSGAQQAAQEAERRVAEAQAVRDAVVAEVQQTWQRLSQVVPQPVDAPGRALDEAVVPTPPAPKPPA